MEPRTISKFAAKANPRIVWDTFTEILCGDFTEMSEIQQKAAMCFLYDTGGFVQHLEKMENEYGLNCGAVCDALRFIGADEQATILQKALALRAAGEDYGFLATEYYETTPQVETLLEKLLYEHQSEFIKIDDSAYTLRQPKFVLVVGIVSAAFFFGFILLMLITAPEQAGLFEILCFLGFISLGVFLIVYAIIWKIEITTERITRHIPFQQARSITYDEITLVKQGISGIALYAGDKKVLVVERISMGYDVLCAYLYALGKMESTQKKYSFTVKQHKGDFWVAFIGFFVFGFFASGALWPDDPNRGFVTLSFACFSIFCLIYIFYLLRWKIEVDKDRIYIRTMFSERSHFVREINKVDVKKNKMVIYIGGVKSVKVAYGCAGSPILIDRLKNECVPFYERGRIAQTRVEAVHLIGVHCPADCQNAYLLELMINCPPSKVRLGAFTQEFPGFKPSAWKTAFDERYLNWDGTEVIGGAFHLFDKETEPPITRIAFFIHLLDLEKPILSQFGEIRLCAETPVPERLRKIIMFEPVD